MDIPEIRKKCGERMKSLETDFNLWKAQFKELKDYIGPERGRFDDQTKPNSGEEVHSKIINNTAGRALYTLASGIYSGLTNPAMNWYKLSIQDKELSEYYIVKEWLEACRRVMNGMLQKSNFYTTAFSTYTELGLFGTGCVLAQPDYKTFIRFYPFTMGQYYLATDQNLRVDSFYRNYKMNNYQLLRMFGAENVTDTVTTQYEKGETEGWHKIVHLIEPNDDRIPIPTKKAYRSIYYQADGDAQKILRIGGYSEFPIMAPRWDVVAENSYGNSPGMAILGDVKMLQKMEDKKLRMIDKQVDPPLNAPATMKKKAITSVPGTVNFMDKNEDTQMLRPTFMVGGSTAEIQNSIGLVIQEIREGLFYDLFRMISNTNDSPQKTAYEISKRHEEKLAQLGPVIERIQPEFLDKVIDRTFQIGMDRGLFPEVPEELEGMDVKIEYISILHQAQKMVQTTSIEQTVSFVGNMAGILPEALDKIDVDETIDQYADMVGVNPKIIHSKDEVKKKRDARAQQQQQQQMGEGMMQAAQGAQILSDTDTGENNALTQLMGRTP
jgi:hypothetical protein